MNNPYLKIHASPKLADLAYYCWRKIYNIKELLRPVAHGPFDMDCGLNVSVTSRCNSRCIFCVHRKLERTNDVMPLDLFLEIVHKFSEFTSRRAPINLTPGVPPGEPLLDPTLNEKILLAHGYGFPITFITNGIALHRFRAPWFSDNRVTSLGISLPSFDPATYNRVYGVDRCDQVVENLFNFLDENSNRGWPVETTICFRNAERPSQIIAHPTYQRLIRYFNPRCKPMFTTWWDDWSGGVPKADMETGQIKCRRPLNLNRICRGSLQFAMQPWDRNIRLCGCRFVQGCDDMIVGNLDMGFEYARKAARSFQDGFLKGKRVRSCQQCSAYKAV